MAVLSTLSLSLFSCKDKGGNGDGGNNQTASGYTAPNPGAFYGFVDVVAVIELIKQ